MEVVPVVLEASEAQDAEAQDAQEALAAQDENQTLDRYHHQHHNRAQKDQVHNPYGLLVVLGVFRLQARLQMEALGIEGQC